MNPWVVKSSLLLITLLMALSFYLLTKPKALSSLSEAELAIRPDSIIEHMHVIEFSAAGHPIHILKTPRLIHYSHLDRSDLQQPRVTIVQENQAPWEIQAELGHTDHGMKQITLYNQVQLHQATAESEQGTTITTSKLIYYPELQVAQTDQPIEFRQPGLHVKSIGMTADLEQDRIELLQDAWGRYETDS